MAQKIYLYAGYYEMFITDRQLPAPYTLISTHRTPEAAYARAAKEHPSEQPGIPGDPVYYKTNLFPDDLTFVLEDSIDRDGGVPTFTIDGDEFYNIAV